MRTNAHTPSKTDIKPSKVRTAQSPKPVAGNPRKVETTAAQATPRVGKSKKQRCLDLLSRREGTTLAELAEVTDWQAHSIRGFLSGTVKTKLGLLLDSAKAEDGSRRYRIDQPRRGRR